jgi:hypothetical protein
VVKKALLVSILAGGLAVSGCQKKGEQQPVGGEPAASGGTPAAPAAGGATPPAAAGVLDPAKVTNGGTITGKISLDGTPPAAKPVEMSSKPECMQAHGGNPPLADNLIVGADKGLKDCFVYIKKGLESYKFEPPADPAVIDQKGCMYVPHVFGMMVQQDLKILNSDPFLHNIKVNDNNPFNLSQVSGAQAEIKKKWFKREQVPVTVQCDVHSWMRSYACVIRHPYFAVTKEDGKFEIKNLPPGKYTLAVWHEPVPKLTAPAEVEVEVKGGDTQTKDFTYTLK